MLSEFGNWGLPDVAHLVDENGREPWWFATGGERIGVDFLPEGIQEHLDEDVVRPEGIKSRFDGWALEEVFGSWHGFVSASQEHQFESLRFEIEDVRRHGSIRGYVITEFTDCHWESNGLLDMARKPKVFHDRFSQVNALDVVLPVPARRRYAPGEDVEIALYCSHRSDERLDGGSVVWSVRELSLRGSAGSLSLRRGDIGELDRVRFTVPALQHPTRATVHFSLRDAFGAEINRNEVALLLLPDQADEPDARVRVAPSWDEVLAEHVKAGGRAVVVATDDRALPAGGTLEVRRRVGTKWQGQWAQGMGWLRPQLTSGLSLLPRVDLVWAGLTPRHVILGYAPETHADVLAGYYVGWLRATVATVASFRHGAGVAIACTFPLLDDAEDPLARAMLRRLRTLAGSRDLAPETELFSP